MYEGFHRRRSFLDWPKISIKGDRITIHGRCMGVWPYALLHRLVQSLILLAVAVLATTALVGWWATELMDIAPTPVSVRLIEPFVQMRDAIDALLHDHAPGLASVVNHRPGTQIDWHVLVVSVLLLLGSSVLRSLIVTVLIAVLWPLLATRFAITITPNRLTARCGFRRVRVPLAREPTLRAVGLERYYSRMSPARLRDRPGGVPSVDAGLVAYPPAMLELVIGGRTRPLLACRHEDRAEAIAAAFEEASRCRPLDLE